MIDNKYVIIERLGKGGTASVYKVKDLNTNKIYAAKVLKDSKYFEKETKLLKLIQNPYIINIVAEGEGEILKNGLSSNKKYIILDFLEPGILFDYIYYPKKGFGEKYANYFFKNIKRCFSMS